MSISLSMCIPTYNRASYIGEAIHSIIIQLEDEFKDKVEIIISDNGSTDNTEEIVGIYQKIHSNIKYYRHDKNMGYECNVSY